MNNQPLDVTVTCRRCGHRWIPLKMLKSALRGIIVRPERCLRCKSPLWDKPYQKKGYEERRNEKQRMMEKEQAGLAVQGHTSHEYHK